MRAAVPWSLRTRRRLARFRIARGQIRSLRQPAAPHRGSMWATRGRRAKCAHINLRSSSYSLTICPTSALGGNMGALTFGVRRLRGNAILAIAFLAWPVSGFAYTADEQQACMGDAFRLCSSEIPDISRVKMCMVRRQAELSEGCRVYFRSSAAPARPLVARATKARKSRHYRRQADLDD